MMKRGSMSSYLDDAFIDLNVSVHDLHHALVMIFNVELSQYPCQAHLRTNVVWLDVTREEIQQAICGPSYVVCHVKRVCQIRLISTIVDVPILLITIDLCR